MRKYLSLEQKTGRFFEYSKDPVEGWEKHTSTTKDGATKVSYRNYYVGPVAGIFKGIKVQDGKFGAQFQVGLESEGITRILSFPYKSPKGYHDDRFLTPLLKVLPGMQMGEEYSVSAYNFTPDDSIYEKSGVKVVDSQGESLPWALTESYYKKTGELTEGDIPPKKFNKNKATNKNEMDLIAFAKRTEYLDKVIEKLLSQKPADFGTITREPNTTTADISRPNSTGIQNAAGQDFDTPAPAPQQEEAPKAEEPKVEVKTEEVTIQNKGVELPF